MGSYSGAREIVEMEEPGSIKQGGKFHPRIVSNDKRPPVLKLGYKDFLEDDINQLFEAINLKNSSKGLGFSGQASASSSPLRKNAMKKPISVPHSPAHGNSEPVSLKQALRELCISKASEMAAIKRMSKPIGSPRISEAGRIKSLYHSVVVETSRSGFPMAEDSRTMVEISLVPEESNEKFSEKMPRQFQVSKVKSTIQSAQSSPRFQALKSLSQSADFSPRFAPPPQNYTGTVSTRNEIVSVKVGTQALKSRNQNALSSPKLVSPKMKNGIGTTPMPKEIVSTPRKVNSQALKSLTRSTDSPPRLAVPTKQNAGTKSKQNDIVSASKKVGTQASKIKMAQREKDTPTSVSCSTSVDNTLKPNVKVPTSTKIASKASAPRSGQKARLTATTSSSNGNRINKVTRNTPRSAKPVTKHRISIKKKIKQGTTSTARRSNGGNNKLVPSMGELFCQKCQCNLKNAAEDTSQGFSASFPANLSSEVSFSNTNPAESKQDFSSSSCNRNRGIGRGKRNSKSREKGEFSQSSKSSLGDYSTSTSNSDESNASRPSCCNRPHMSKDFRWEAIRFVKMRDGVLSLRHFNLLKKLGCGDIGTVYLAELIGSNCLFAIKVMDNEFLARRKKMPRAQTEREILRMLDHPFLPTLYAQFTSDNLSCLVMEYCPGGDLHVLRQKQPGRSFPEPAARFYVAEVLLALEYLHMLGVVYRDLKPENILVREDGHIMLTDFDLSLRCSVSPTLMKSPPVDTVPPRMSGPCTESSCIQPFCIEPSCQVSCFSPRFLPAAAKARKMKAENAAQVRSLPQLVAEPSDARSNSFVGTHEYLAPEIIKGEGHGAAVDWWTFGIFLFELLYGKTPFKGSVNDETLANVVLQSLKFPDSPLVSFQARDLIRGLLVKEPENRLGTEKGAAEIKQHPFFEGLNWALIRCAIPPELPEFYGFGVPNNPQQQNQASNEMNGYKYLESNATGEHLKFELF